MCKANLKEATPRPNAGETFKSFYHRALIDPLFSGKGLKTRHKTICRVFKEYNQFFFKNRDLQFFTSVEYKIQQIMKKYTPEVQAALDETNKKVAEAISRGGVWEHLVTNEEILAVLKENYEETGEYVNNAYAGKYGGTARDLAAVMGTGLLFHLSRYEEPFNKKTKAKIQTIIEDSDNPVDEILKMDNKPRAKAIVKTETGIAQAIAENETMLDVAAINPVKKYWIGRIDDKIRDSHLTATRRYNPSNLINFDQMFYVNGEAMRHPRDYEASAKNTSNCRCYLGYVINGVL